MSEAGPEALLARRLLEAVEHLQAERPAQAVPLLTEVCDDPDLAAAGDLHDVRARAHSLLAQALLASGRPSDARPPLAVAQQLVTDLDDRDAMKVLAELGSQISAAEAEQDAAAHRARQSERLAALPLADIEARVSDPMALIEVLIRKANADADAGRPADALPVAERALVQAMSAADPRLEVLARLSIARVAPGRAEAELHAALRCADRASETSLITAVAKAAELHGVTLPAAPKGGRPL